MSNKTFSVWAHDAHSTVLGAHVTMDEALDLHEQQHGHATIIDDSTGTPACMRAIDLACECQACFDEASASR